MVREFFSKFGFILNLGASFLLILAYLSPFVPPDLFWPISFFGLAYPFLVLLNLIFLVLWALKPSKKIGLPIICLLIGFTCFKNTFQIFPGSISHESGIKVLSYNVHGFRSDLRLPKINPPKILSYFKATGSGVICLQEGALLKGKKLSPQGIKDALPEINYYEQALAGNNFGLVTFSKYPIVDHGEIRFPGSSNLVLFTDLKISNRQIIRVYNCHLQSYSIDPDDYSLIDSIGMASNSRQIAEARKVSFKLRNGFKLRALQARKIAEHVQNSPYPVVVCGDFNDTPVSYAYRKVRGNLKDAFVESGWGISHTYNGDLPPIRIDYILCDQKMVAKNYQRDRVNFSDHFPIHCQLSFE